MSLGKTDVTTSNTADREISGVRMFDAPRELVWKVWTEREHWARWWGPRGFTNTIQEMDVRTGGAWRFVMHGPDGTDYQNNSTYVEVVRPERLVYDHLSGPRFRATVTLEDVGGNRTKLTMRMVFPTAAERDLTVQKFNAVEGLNQTLDRLTEQLGSASGAGSPFVISRVFDAPRQLVWKAWTERDRLMEWFGPKGFVMSAAKLDLRPGGSFHYCLRSPQGHEMWGKFVYREVVPPERIVLVNSFSDADGNLTRHPMSPNWPLEMLTTTTFVEQGANRTAVTIQWSPLNATAEECQVFEAGRGGMQQGWTGTFEQLAAYLAKGRNG